MLVTDHLSYSVTRKQLTLCLIIVSYFFLQGDRGPPGIKGENVRFHYFPSLLSSIELLVCLSPQYKIALFVKSHVTIKIVLKYLILAIFAHFFPSILSLHIRP